MKKLKEQFGKNDLKYKMVERTDKVVMYQLLSKDTGVHVSYEVWDIPVNANDHQWPNGSWTKKGDERNVSNSEFGRLYRSQCFKLLTESKKWFEQLNEHPDLTTPDIRELIKHQKRLA